MESNNNKNLKNLGKMLLLVGMPIFIVDCLALAVFGVMSFNLPDIAGLFTMLRNISALVFLAGAIMLFVVIGIDQKVGVIEPIKRRAANADSSVQADISSGYFNIVMHVILLLVTFGIWNLIWIYRTTDYLNIIKSEPPRNPVTKLLLCMFIPFYSLYWTYKSAQRIDKLSAEKGSSSNMAVICLILALFIGIVPPIIMQHKINEIAEV